MNQTLFITGTDTEVGKTFISGLLMEALLENGHQTVGYFKPIECGSEAFDSDVIADRFGGRIVMAPSVYRLKAPIVPVKAAQLENQEINLSYIMSRFSDFKQKHPADYWLVEGVGGVDVPLAPGTSLIDLMVALAAPTLVVVRAQLGAINHTLLTLARLKAANLKVSALIVNGDDSLYLKETLESQTDLPIISIPTLPNLSDRKSMKGFARKMLPIEYLAMLFPKKENEHSNSELIELSKIDERVLWHPFTQHQTAPKNQVVESAKGAHLYLADGSKIIDAISSWWVNLHGHAHPEIVAAIASQGAQLEHTLFAGFTHEPAIQLGKILNQAARQAGSKLNRVFYSDNGSTSVEVALKMAVQYQSLSGYPERSRFLALRGGYHGDTLGAMSVSARDGFHQPFAKLMPPVDFVTPDDFEELEGVLERSGQLYAAFIFEPLIQGAGGMRCYSPEFLQLAQTLCRKQGVLSIADEVFTGFYRTGTCFAFSQATIEPDLLCLSKGITGGYLPLAATLATEEIFEKFLSPNLGDAFLHGHSYTANPLGCAAGLKSWEILQRPATQLRIKEISQWTTERLARLNAFEIISHTRSLGTIGAFNLKGEESYFKKSQAHDLVKQAFKQGVYLRPLGSAVYTVPPFCIEKGEFHYIYDVIENLLAKS